MTPPNILYIFTDQQSATAMSCAGNPEIHTPALDRLAATGMRFDRAYCTYPLCTPSRASMFSGRMPHEVGITENSPIARRLLRKLRFPHGTLGSSVIRGEEVIIPSGDEILRVGDNLIVFSKAEAVQKLERLFTKPSKFTSLF